MSMPRIRVILPCLNEAAHITATLESVAISAQLVKEVAIDILLVDDGSTDATYSHAINFSDTSSLNVDILCFTHNFGKEAAIYAGLRQSAHYDAVIVMDADLEHPPELIPEFVEAWRAGNAIVEAKRSVAPHRTGLHSIGATLFYSTMQRLSGIDLALDCDYKLLDKAVVQTYLKMPERTRFFKGMVRWIDQPSHTIEFTPPARRNSAWSLRSLAKYGVDAVTSYSILPLQLVSVVGFLVFLISMVFLARAMYMKFAGIAVDGFTTVIGLQALFASAIMFSLGVMGIYLGKIYEEIKDRPLYITDYGKSRIRNSDENREPRS
jgi:glycosyltransferase involved in cell wall biosynthesis